MPTPANTTSSQPPSAAGCQGRRRARSVPRAAGRVRIIPPTISAAGAQSNVTTGPISLGRPSRCCYCRRWLPEGTNPRAFSPTTLRTWCPRRPGPFSSLRRLTPGQGVQGSGLKWSVAQLPAVAPSTTLERRMTLPRPTMSSRSLIPTASSASGRAGHARGRARGAGAGHGRRSAKVAGAVEVDHRARNPLRVRVRERHDRARHLLR
jgi:hypothetical protein